MFIKIDLSEILGADQFVNIRHPKALSWKSQKAIALAAQTETLEGNMGVAETLAIALVANGHVLDENGSAIKFPLTVETIGDVPAVVVESVAQKFAEIKGMEGTAKKA